MMRLTRAVLAWVMPMLVLAGSGGTSAWGREVKLVIRPAGLPLEAGEYSLMPGEKTLIDADAVPLYEKAAKALPADATAQIKRWLELPVEQLPTDQADQVIQQHLESLRAVAKAARCQRCVWPEWRPGMEIADLGQYRKLAFVVRLWARLEIARGGYDGAMLALQTGFGMARHLGQAPTIVQALVGGAIGGLMAQEVEQFIQGQGAPNLHWALAALPEPLIDMEKAIETERAAAHAEMNEALRAQMEGQMAGMFARVRLIAKRLDSQLRALQCVEAIRACTARQAGQLPEDLTEIGNLTLPKDPLSGQPYAYTKTGATAVLQSARPKGGGDKDRIRYEIVVRK